MFAHHLQEKPRDPLDFRGRLDGKGAAACTYERLVTASVLTRLASGERYGKVIDYRMSELRTIELLGGLCARLANHAMWTPSPEWLEKHPEELPGKQWVKITGDGAHPGASEDVSLKGAKGKAHNMEIQAYCGTLIETLEDQLTEALRADGFLTNTTEQRLCRRLSPACRGIRRKPKAAAHAPDGTEEERIDAPTTPESASEL